MLGRFKARPGFRAGFSPLNPDGSLTTRREGFLLSTLWRRQRKVLRAWLCAPLCGPLYVFATFWLTLLAALPAQATITIDDPAILASDSGTIASNEDIVSLLLGITFWRYDAAATPDTLVTPVTLNNGTTVLPGPVDGDGSPLMGSISNPVITTLPLIPAGANPVFGDGEAVFFRTVYPSFANDPALIDVARVRVQVFNGTTLLDEEVLEIYETGINTGVFTGYFQNNSGGTGIGDNLLSLPPGARIELVDLDDTGDFRPELDTLVTATVDSGVVPTSNLFVTKRAQRDTVAIGDFLQYQVTIENTTTVDATNVVLSDRLPPGFRYRKGSTTLNGVRIADPAIARDGVSLTFVVGNLVAGSTAAEIRYVVEVGAGARRGKATNTATADGDNTPVSTPARAVVKVTEDLFRTEAIIVGRVLLGCDGNEDVEQEGVAGVRLYLEDGTTVVTDSQGRYHLAGVSAGNHVLQIDTDSLADGLEPVACTDNTRIAGNALSQFIDVQGGTLWRANFHVRPKQAATAPTPVTAVAPVADAVPEPVINKGPEGSAGLRLASSTEMGFVRYRVDISGGDTFLDSVDLLLNLPEQLQLVPGSVKRDGKEIDVLKETDSIRRVKLGNVGSAWKLAIEFDAITRSDDAVGDAETTAWLVINTSEGPVHTPIAANTVKIHPGSGGDEVQITVSTNFAPMAAELSGIDKLKLGDVVAQLRDLVDPVLTVTGHTDSSPVPKSTKSKKYPYADNHALSQARAQAVADYLRAQLQLPPEAVTVIGAGPDQPVGDNKTLQGRAKNRRVEVGAQSRTALETGGLELTVSDSGEQTVQIAAALAEAAALEAADLAAAAEPVSAESVSAESVAAESVATEPVAAEPVAADSKPATSEADRDVTIKPGFLDFVDGQNLTQRIQQFRVAMDSRLTPKLLIDGKEVSNERIGYRGADRKTNITLYSYIGVDVGERGEHSVQLLGTDTFGNVRLDQTIRMIRTGDIRSVRMLVEDAPVNVADGKTPVLMKVEILDDQQRVIMGGASLSLLEGELTPEHADNAADLLERTGTRVLVDRDGMIRFKPVTQAGRYRLRLAWGPDQYEDFTLFVKPHFRDWILVGIAEGSVLHRTISGNTTALSADERDEGFSTDGRMAFFAKGKVRGDWLLTAAYDTDKARVDGLTDSIDPNGWYTLYGDASSQDQDAPSSRKLYLKIERENFYALFGNFDTGFDTTELTRYQRRLNGVKTEYWGNVVDTTVFASETRQAYVRDALRGDGTSGLYKLRYGNVLPNSDRLTLEVRDRFNSAQVLESRTLTRFLDYNLDYDAGTIWFKEPVQSQDDAFNPVYIVAEYEVDNGVEDFTAGVRVEGRSKGGLTIGVTGVREGLGNGSASLAGIDVEAKIDARNTVTVEAANTANRLPLGGTTPNGTPGTGQAFLIRHEYNSDKLAAETYVREYDTGFGIGQNSATESATRKLGTDLRYSVSDRIKIDGELSHQEQLDNGQSRDLAEARVNLESDRRALFGGVRLVEEETTAGPRSSQQLLGGVRQRVLDNRLELKLQGETNIAESAPNSLDYPHRLIAGGDYRLSNQTSVFADQEFAWGSGQDSQHTRAGLRHIPWNGAEFNTALGRELAENGPRVYANAGLVQNWNINARWTADAGIDRVETIEDPGTRAFDPDVVPTNGDGTEDFTALFVGAGFHDDEWSWRSRIEFRNGASEDKLNLYSGVNRQLNEADTLGGSLRYQSRSGDNGDLDVTSTLQFDYAYRPLVGRWIVLNQAQYVIDQRETAGNSLDGQRVVNNLNGNWQYDERNQLGLQYGAKFVFDTIDDVRYSGYTDVIGAEYRHDLTEQWDAGVRTSLLHSWSAGNVDESYGVFVGWSPVPNLWLSLGYNVKGFRDDDFAGAAYRDQGFNLAFRMKFDQHSVRDLAARRRAPIAADETGTETLP